MTLRSKALIGPGTCEMTPDMVVVGKDVLELLSSAMYLDPMTIYREYVQNAADAVDEARDTGLIEASKPGAVYIDVDPISRTVKIRDNGVGLSTSAAPRRLLSVGASYKRGANLRGFRGVGRLAGLGYCRELVFRAKAAGDLQETEVTWDCRGLKSKLRDPAFTGDIVDLVKGVVQLSRNSMENLSDHYFEVEMRGIVRHKNDALLDVIAIRNYLSQVAPVPFSPDFQFGAEISAALMPAVRLGSLNIFLNGDPEPLYRPHRDSFPISDVEQDRFRSLEVFELKGIDGGVAAVGWLLHHNYFGAIPVRAILRGLRGRCGDIQVGDSALFEDCFQEDRFNGWVVGEVHIVDRRVLPNGRRDHFEQNAHFNHIHAQLVPIGRRLVRTCRESSLVRNRLRDFQKNEQAVVLTIDAGVCTQESVAMAHQALHEMRRIAASKVFQEPERIQMSVRIADLSAMVASMLPAAPRKLVGETSLPRQYQECYFGISKVIQALVSDHNLAQALLNKIEGVFLENVL